MLTGLAHTAVCVRDLDEAVAWYTSVLGLELLSPPFRMEGEQIERDMGELVPGVAMRAAILGFAAGGDNVLELIEYPRHPGRARPADVSLTDHGLTHIGVVCDDVAAERARLEARGVAFLTRGIAGIAGLATTWFRDPFGVVFILMEKRADPAAPYFRQVRPRRGA